MGKSAGDVCGTIVFCMCGPKGSLCCFILSLWGLLMLFLLGGFYWIEAVALFEDIKGSLVAANSSYPLSGVVHYRPSDVTSAYQKAAYSCWGAGVIYLFFAVLSGSFMIVNIWRAKHKAQ